ncbi:MAG: hypothetical protein IPL86_17480 [Flavobacteriales bacterium]|nr:hypothetical protein [Flavobacteriales bacterium]
MATSACGEHRTGASTAAACEAEHGGMRGVNDDELLRFVELTRDRPVHVRFIEFMPFAGNKWGRDRVYTYSEMLGRIGSTHAIEKLNDDPHSTAKSYRVKGWLGTFAGSVR